MAAVADGDDPAALPADPEEEALKREIDVHKGTYKDGFARLRDLKKEIEHLQMILEQSRVRLQVSGPVLLPTSSMPSFSSAVEPETRSEAPLIGKLIFRWHRMKRTFCLVWFLNLKRRVRETLRMISRSSLSFPILWAC
jgi:hypothetical protein